MTPLNYNHLYYFFHVDTDGSITRASARLNLTPQTISGQIAAFEGQLGTKLFRREGRRLRLVCHEGDQETLLAELAVNRLDCIITDQPLESGSHIKAWNYRILDSGFTFFAVPEFDDSALLKSFGQAGLGIFVAPSIIEDYVRNHGVRLRLKGGRESSMACP